MACFSSTFSWQYYLVFFLLLFFVFFFLQLIQFTFEKRQNLSVGRIHYVARLILVNAVILVFCCFLTTPAGLFREKKTYVFISVVNNNNNNLAIWSGLQSIPSISNAVQRWQSNLKVQH